MITLTIDGKEVQVPEGTSILKAAEQSGIWIPTMCYSELFDPYAVCRLCSVEVTRNNRSEIVTSCNHPVTPGMTVNTQSENAVWTRKVLMELMLSRWPNVPVVQQLAERLGVGKPRFVSLEADEAPDACMIVSGISLGSVNGPAT